MSTFTLTDSQLDQLLQKFDLSEIKTALRIINSIDDSVQPDPTVFYQLRRDKEMSGILPKAGKKDKNPFAALKAKKQSEGLLPA
ncbi:MAG: hypothetical protein PHI28_04350 [Mangrovibacterium sp.]|nr:hypothetical protein [Mangrovibacterium sp.]